ncbi:MAG: hypothetical protein KGL43_23570 [Burkholderiales bacterium]|nr:hypothetical protein [Burkholderiales bacterium]MDE2456576.1 hypothetical protein [Burkholderiales bacterium]
MSLRVRRAPPVVVVCSGGSAWHLALALLPASAVASLCAWVLLQSGLEAWAGGTASIAAGCVAAAIAWRRTRPRAVTLGWSGERWSADGLTGQVEVMIDLGGWLLLRLRPESGPARWLPVAASEAGASARLLRAALYAPAPKP